MNNLFTPYKVKNVELKNRIVMSPMCMYSSDHTGKANSWHYQHLLTRAIGGTGLIMQESTAVHPNGRITEYDLGIWDDEQVSNLTKITDKVHEHNAKIGIQLGHAGRKADISGEIYSPNDVAYNENYKTPKKLTEDEIKEVIDNYKTAAVRAGDAGYDVIEIHAAHGYLISSFLSPLTNKREDKYGGSYWNRFRILEEIIETINSVWKGPLFVRISAEDYHLYGNHPEDFIDYAIKMKEMGVDLIDCSSGAVVPAKIETYPGYQVRFAEIIKKSAQIDTGAVGLIYDYSYADELIRNSRSDLVFIGRGMLREPYWALNAANNLNYPVDLPKQYERAFARGRTSS